MHLRILCLSGGALLAIACGGDGPTEPPPGAPGVSLVVAPGALLFAAAGEAQQLKAYSVDADGDSTAIAATFESSAPGSVAVTAAGLATGGASIGSAQIVARSGALVSAPVLALRATPADGALLVADSQIVGTIAAVDPAAPYQVGWRYRVRLRGVTPVTGQVVLATGGAPVGGRVVSATPAGADTETVLELIPVQEMFAELEVNQQLSLEHASLAVPAALRQAFRVTPKLGGGIRLEAREQKVRFAASAAYRSLDAAQVEQEFLLGPFKCKAEVPPGFVFPLTLDVFSFELDPSLTYDVAFSGGVFQHAVVTGGIAPRITASPRITAALEAKAECKIQLTSFTLPVGGPLALIVGGQVPLGVGFEIGGKVTFGQLGYDALVQAAVSARFGLDCAAGCQVVTDITSSAPTSYFKPVLPDLGTDVRFEFGMSGFGWGELAIGNKFVEAWQFKTVELKAGLEQKFELASREAQAADPAYASTFSLKPVLEAKAAANLAAIANLLSINLATLTFAPELPTLAQSPRGTFTITPASVAPGDGTQLGEMATFTVNLTDVTYLGAYAVEGIEIRWQKTNGSTVTLEPGRPGCTDLAAAEAQVSFSCDADFLEEHEGTQTFYAFVKTRIFGVPLPVPLEIALDAKATVKVSSVTVSPTTVELAPGAVQQFSASISGVPDQAVTWTGTGGTISASGLYTAASTAGTYAVTATSVADPTQSATATVAIVASNPPPGSATVRVIRDSVMVLAGGRDFFSAVVTPSPANAVTWTATGGTISAASPTSGAVYTAGQVPGTYAATATSIDAPGSTGTAKIVIVAAATGAYAGTFCAFLHPEDTSCTPQPIIAVVSPPLTVNGKVYVGFAWTFSVGDTFGCHRLARLVSGTGSATLVGTGARVCAPAGISGDIDAEGSWSGTFSGSLTAGHLVITEPGGDGTTTYDLNKTAQN